MTFYSFALFLHIVGALGLFIAIGLEWTSLWYLRRAMTTEQAREWLNVFGLIRWIGAVSLVAILIPGFYMTATVWGGVAWIGLSLAALILIAVLGAVLTGRRMAAIGPAVAREKGPVSPALHQRLHDPLLWASIQTRAAIALAIVFLMTVKPGLGASLLTIGVAVIIGLTSTLSTRGRGRLEEAREEN